MIEGVAAAKKRAKGGGWMEEAQLVRQAMLGHPPALEALIDQYYSGIYAFCCRRVGNAALGADLCQDTFVKMVEHLPAYKEKGRFKSWLFTIAANCCRDALRKSRPTAQLDDSMKDKTAPFEENTENAQLIQNALARLPENQREAVVLRYYHGFALADIARIQRVPAATAKTRLHRGLKRLQAIFGEEILLER